MEDNKGELDQKRVITVIQYGPIYHFLGNLIRNSFKVREGVPKYD